MGLPTSHDLRCPRCGAHVRQDADWCTLCYADLRPAPPEPEPEPTAAVPPHDPLTDPLPAPRPGGRHARLAEDAADADAGPVDGTPAGEDALAGVDVDAMLASLKAQSASGLSPIVGRLDSKGSKALVIGGGIAVVAVVLFVVMAVAGALL